MKIPSVRPAPMAWEREEEYERIQTRDILAIYLMEQKYFVDSYKLRRQCISFVHDQSFSYVCRRYGRVVGFVRAGETDDGALIDTLCVEQADSNTGIGRRLLKLCIRKILRVNRDAEITLMVSERNATAKRLYEDLGFVVKEYSERVYFNGSNGFVMVLRRRR